MVISKPSERMLIAMSGGVDSSVAALLMKNEGKKAVGVILRMHDVGMTAEELSGGKLPVNIWSAREAARRIRMEFNIIDVRDDFTEKVKERFLGIYKQGIITDPCVFCNAEFKIPFLIETAKKMDCGKIVTGHYAKTELDEKTGRYILRKARDRENDQSYMLYRLSQEQLSKLVTPLGYMKKSDVRHMAEEARLKNANAPGSAEICFIPDNDIAAYAEKNTDFREEKLMRAAAGSSKNMRVSRVNFVSIDGFKGYNTNVSVRFRYSSDEVPARVRQLTEDSLELEFDEEVKMSAPGQSVVLYDGDMVLAGGIVF